METFIYVLLILKSVKQPSSHGSSLSRELRPSITALFSFSSAAGMPMFEKADKTLHACLWIGLWI